MALHWNLNAIPDHESLCFMASPYNDPAHGIKKGDRIMNPVSNTMIWVTLAIDIGNWTPAAMPEVWARISTYQALFGALMADQDGPIYLTKDQVMAHVGLSTNVSYKSKTVWRKHVMDRADKEAGNGWDPEPIQYARKWREARVAERASEAA